MIDPEKNIHHRKLAQQKMGEDVGVARSGDVFLESSTAGIGPKCDSPSCLQREGLGGIKFKRCSGCKKVFYCSEHCQVCTARPLAPGTSAAGQGGTTMILQPAHTSFEHRSNAPYGLRMV